jgi:hypothetical protein
MSTNSIGKLFMYFIIFFRDPPLVQKYRQNPHNWINILRKKSYFISIPKTLTRKPMCLQDTHALVSKHTREYICSQTLRDTCVYGTLTRLSILILNHKRLNF